MAETVRIYTKQIDETGHCPFCDRAKEFLVQKGIPFEESMLDPLQRQAFYADHDLVGGEATVPQVFLTEEDGEVHRIGGYTQLTLCGIESLFQHEPR